MSKLIRIGNAMVVLIAPEPNGKCELCGTVDELRPYGPRGERICFDCGQKAPATTKRQMDRVLFGDDVA